MLADMMPKDVAKALIMDFSKQQAHGNRRASRYSSAGGWVMRLPVLFAVGPPGAAPGSVHPCNDTTARTN